jgi:uncharacterized peroxidase-related enzyme
MQTHRTTFAAARRTPIPSPRGAPRSAKIIRLPNRGKHGYFPRAATIFYRRDQNAFNAPSKARQKPLPAVHRKLQTIPHRMADDKHTSGALSFRKVLAMAHIKLPEGIPGIRGPMMFRPETAKPLNELVDTLLRGPHPLSPGERELIATYVSSQNDCRYCQTIHGAIAAHHLDGNEELVSSVKYAPEKAQISAKLKALLAIAGKVQQSGKEVTARDVERARAEGASDLEIHDTVLIAAVFCMCNRYVDGLATWAPDDPDFYRQRAAIVATKGYVASTLATAAVK